MPPYKPYLKEHKSVKIFDILSAIEGVLPNSINPIYL
jgi:hypothetical protein